MTIQRLMEKIKYYLFKKNLLLILILILGFYMRVDDIYTVTFDATTGSFLEPSLNFLNTRKLPLLGVEISGLINADMGPLLTYLYAIPLLISKNPISAIIFSALLNTLGIFFFYLLARDLFKRRAALISIAFVAVNPFLIHHSRTVSNVSLLFLFLMIYFWSAFSFFIKNKSRFLPLVFFSIACMLQIHILSAILILLSLSYFLIFKPKINMKHLLSGILIFLFLFSPYIYYELTNNFENSINTLQLFTRSTGISSQSASPSSIIYPFIFFNTYFDRLGYYRISDKFLNESINLTYKKWDTISAKMGDFMFLLGLIFIFLILGYIILKKNKSLINIKQIKCPHIKKYLFLLLWLLIPLLFFVFFKINVYIRYYIYLLPINFIILGYFLDFIIKNVRKNILSKAIKYILLIIILCMIFSKVAYLSHMNNIILKEGIVDKEIPLKNKLELVSFFTNKNIDYNTFYQNSHFIEVGEDWKGGFDFIFGYFSQKDKKELYSKDKSKHYFLMLDKKAAKFLENRIKYDKIDNLKKYSIIEYTPSINYSSWKISKIFHPGWFRYRLKSENWSEIDLPFYGRREIEELFLRGNINVNNKADNTFLVISSRAGVENLYINEKLVENKTCPRGWRLEEISPFKYEFNITEYTKVGTNIIAMKLINIDKHFTIEIYDMVFNK